MQELIFKVKGSATEPYEVIFVKDGDSLTALCNCPAGSHGNSCKHRINILDGKKSGISSDNSDRVSLVVDWLAGTDVEKALAEVRAIEKDKDSDKNELSAAKRRLARAMNT